VDRVHRGHAEREIDRHIVSGEGEGGPEKSTWRDAGVEVVDLDATRLAQRASEQVKSDEDEGVLVELAIHADVLTLHEANVGVEIEG